MEHIPTKSEELGMSGEDALNKHVTSVLGVEATGSWESAGGFMGSRSLSHVDYYKQEDEVPNWLYITFGFSELDEKETDDPAVSGSGYEITFREKRGAEEGANEWVNSMLNEFAGYSFSTGTAFKPYDYLEYPFNASQETAFEGVLFVPDPQLGETETPNGKVQFMQAVPLLKKELQSLMDLNPKSEKEHTAYMEKVTEIQEMIASTDTKLYVTNLDRK